MSKREVSLQGKTFQLVGTELKVGAPIPDPELIDTSLGVAKLSKFRGKTLIVLSVPSLDTPVCSLETKRFNAEVAKLGDLHLIVVSMDLPFAQKRWCGAEKTTCVVALSDYRKGAFGEAFGVKIAEINLLARAVFVVDPQGILRYTQLVPVVSDEPNYDEVLAQVQQTVKK